MSSICLADKMELLDSRCSKCRPKDWQCSNCQNIDSQRRIKARKEAAAAAAAKKREAAPTNLDRSPSPAPAPSGIRRHPGVSRNRIAGGDGPASGDSHVHFIPDNVAPLMDADLERVFPENPGAYN